VLAAALATRQDQPAASTGAETPTEERLAAAFAKVLGVPVEQVTRQDNFFDQGGTSLSAVKLAIALRREVSLTDITHNAVLTDLARLIDNKSRPEGRSDAEPDAVSGRAGGREPKASL
jgi:acyl carrier protein